MRAPNFGNGKRCAKNYSAKQEAALGRPFVQFDGEGETANARERDIGGHAAVPLRQIRYR